MPGQEPDKQNPAPSGEEPAVVETDVEQLLRRAENLASEIAETLTDEPGRAQAPRAEPGTEIPPAEDSPDALLAVDQADQASKELNALLSGPTSDAPTTPVDDGSESAPARAESPTVDIATDDGASGRPTGAPDSSVVVAPSPQAPRARHEPSTKPDPLADAPETPDTETAEDEPVGKPATQPAPPDEVQPAPTPQPTAPLWKRAVAGGVRALAALGRLPPAALVFLLELADRPFRHVPPRVKSAAGAFAIASVLMGAAAYVLPRMLAHNPYENMPPFPVAPEHKADGAASEHAETAPPPAAAGH